MSQQDQDIITCPAETSKISIKEKLKESLSSGRHPRGKSASNRRAKKKHRSQNNVSALPQHSTPHQEIDGKLTQSASQPTEQSSSARLVIESTLRKSAGILSEFTENTIIRSGSNYESLLHPERFGITSSSGFKKSHNMWSDNTPSMQCSISSAAPRKKPDMSKLPKNIVQLLKEDNSCVSIVHKNRASPRRYHSKKMALKQCGDDTSSKIDLPVAHIKSTSSSETKAPKIVVVSAPLNLDSQNAEDKILRMPPDRFESKIDTKNPFAPYRRLNHTNIIQSIKEAIEKVPYNSTKYSKEQHQQQVQAAQTQGKNEPRVGTSTVRKIMLGVEKGVAFVVGPKTKHPYYNTFGGVRDTKWLNESSYNCKWVINIGNFHDNEISFSLQDNMLTITGFRQPSLKYPEGQTVSETITIPAGFDINNLRVYRSNNANELMVLEEVVPKQEMNHEDVVQE